MRSQGVPEIKALFLPFPAHGHMLPALDIAKLFTSHGVNCAIVTTPLNAPIFTKSIQRTQHLGDKITLKIVKFPAVEAGLPQDCENAEKVTSEEMSLKFVKAAAMLQDPFEKILRDVQPQCLVADMFFPWASHVAAKFGIRRLSFLGTSFFSLCAGECLRLYKPQVQVSSDSEPFEIPGLPDTVEVTRKQIPYAIRSGEESEINKWMESCVEDELKSYGVLVNSFYELEPTYADYFRNVLKRRAWHIGPVSLCNREKEEKARRGKETAVAAHECLTWLDSKDPNSVVYVCFGSMSHFDASQLREIAVALEASGKQFIWVVRKSRDGDENEDWLPSGFEKRMKNRGLIVRGWAPQVLILEHKAIGAFVTHCGWNSTLEGISSGVPLVTWPLFAEQFLNEKLVTQVLRIGVSVGAKEYARFGGETVKSERIEEAINRVMEGEEAEKIRSKAKAFGDLAKKAVERGGSSYNDLKALIEELRYYQT
ncbi:UDP-glucuronosyl/UDP-glucosyltransferase [Dillenia turbinata]|uniref:Glycosyltransferase n=1 Tax=Dillenia turbinata TaxID=194707 RepID=A0AAN8W6A6_9MAGN